MSAVKERRNRFPVQEIGLREKSVKLRPGPLPQSLQVPLVHRYAEPLLRAVDQLVREMNRSIAEADKFIQTMGKEPG